MKTLKQGFEECYLAIAMDAERLVQDWRSRLAMECPEQSVANRESIMSWLFLNHLKQYGILNQEEQKIVHQAVEYRYQILRRRYLGITKERAYRNLITRLGSLVTLRPKIQTWVAKSRNHQRTVLDVLQEVIEELLQSDNYIQQQMVSIAQYTTDEMLKNALLFASLEEYCLRPVRNQPLLVYCFVNYVRNLGV
ncbi:hypothetical protein V5G28_002920 [Scytonema sp. PRP1]